MDDWKTMVPTYNANRYPELVESGALEEYGLPRVPVVVCEADGVRIVLGTHDTRDGSQPDVQVERRPAGWAIFLQPVGGGGSVGYVYLLDDGRSYVRQERFVDPPLVVLEPDDTIPEMEWGGEGKTR